MRFGPWMRPVFSLLAKLKGLRGTAFDPFGYTAERRAERALIREYEQNVDTVLASLDRDRLALAVEIAAIPDSIRGFGHVKRFSMQRAAKHREELLARYLNPHAGSTPPRRAPLPEMKPGNTAALAILLALSSAAVSAQSLEPAQIESGNETIAYSLRRFDPPPAITGASASLPDSAVDTARRIAGHLAAGEIEEAALLSNAPKRRFEVLMDYREAVGEAEFKRVFGEYADPRNPLLAELAIGPRRALVWRLGPGQPRRAVLHRGRRPFPARRRAQRRAHPPAPRVRGLPQRRQGHRTQTGAERKA